GGGLSRCGVAGVGNPGKCVAKLLAGADVELGEHLAKVVLDGAGADEQLGADLRVRLPVGGESGDLGLLRGEDVACFLGTPARRLSGGEELATSTLGERVGPEAPEHLVRG